MKISELVTKAYETAKSKGFHEPGRNISFGDRIALCHTELSEALEAYRSTGHFDQWLDGKKPEGVPSELADTVIRICDMCGVYGINLEKAIEEKLAFNATRPVHHGKRCL